METLKLNDLFFSHCSFQTMQEHAAVFRTGTVLADGCRKIDDIYNQTEDLKVQTQLDFCLKAFHQLPNSVSHHGHLKLHFAFENQNCAQGFFEVIFKNFLDCPSTQCFLG